MTTHVYRAEGNALAGQPDFPAAAGPASCVSTSALDTGTLYLETRTTGFEVQVLRVQLDGTAPVVPANVLRVNKAYYRGADGSGCVGTITVTVDGIVLATIIPTPAHANDNDPGKSAWDCVYSVGPGLVDVVLADVTDGVTIKHRKGQSPHNVTVVAGDTAPGIGDFWAEGTGFAQFDLEARR